MTNGKIGFQRHFLPEAFSGVSRLRKFKLPWGLSLYQSINTSNEEKADLCILYSPKNRSSFQSVWGCFILANIGLIPYFSKWYLNSRLQLLSSWILWAPNSLPWSIISLTISDSLTSWGLAGWPNFSPKTGSRPVSLYCLMICWIALRHFNVPHSLFCVCMPPVLTKDVSGPSSCSISYPGLCVQA